VIQIPLQILNAGFRYENARLIVGREKTKSGMQVGCCFSW